MSGFTEYQASDAGEQVERPSVVLSLGTARRMVPLLRRIVADILIHQHILAELGPEQDWLDEQRRKLSWPQRQRRYQVHEEVAAARRELEEALAELEVLGVALVDVHEGRVGLPTVVNNRLAYFSWKPGENTVQYWHFPAEAIRRPIPASWSETGSMPLKSRG
jgi:hypothetical protein